MKTAIISVHNKIGIENVGRELVNNGYTIISSGGTYNYLKENGIDTIKVEDYTKFPEILNGRVKTLHPFIFGGILARGGDTGHIEQLKKFNIKKIGLVICNLYPFEDVIKKIEDLNKILENIDIGGVSLLRAAAKNYRDVIVIYSPEQYDWLIENIKFIEKIDETKRRELAFQAFAYTSYYDSIISRYLLSYEGEGIFPKLFTYPLKMMHKLRYGENPHQEGYVYKTSDSTSIIDAEQLQGKKLSFNNIFDGDLAFRVCTEMKEKVCVIIKHGNPCGLAVNNDPLKAFENAFASDPVSSFGGIIGFNSNVSENVAKKITEGFYEIVLAPDFDDDALKVFSKKKNLRILKYKSDKIQKEFSLKKIIGGFLIQDEDNYPIENVEFKVVTEKKPDENLWNDIKFGFRIAKYYWSNSIILVKDMATVGCGFGQPSRIDAAKIAVEKAGDKVKGSVMISDAFFPFPDCVELAGKYGISCIVQPGGSIRDKDSIDKCNELGIPMVFTGIRHFRH